MRGLLPILRGLAFGLLGFAVGAVGAALIRAVMGLDPWVMEVQVAAGYPFGLVGWLMGVGMWER